MSGGLVVEKYAWPRWCPVGLSMARTLPLARRVRYAFPMPCLHCNSSRSPVVICHRLDLRLRKPSLTCIPFAAFPRRLTLSKSSMEPVASGRNDNPGGRLPPCLQSSQDPVTALLRIVIYQQPSACRVSPNPTRGSGGRRIPVPHMYNPEPWSRNRANPQLLFSP